ncbi:MAG: hypothetical protein JW730_18715, partial [Anaerolineales bacterium]|nr:hypothetical protein [Anaerolineales bacterium]
HNLVFNPAYPLLICLGNNAEIIYLKFSNRCGAGTKNTTGDKESAFGIKRAVASSLKSGRSDIKGQSVLRVGFFARGVPQKARR